METLGFDPGDGGLACAPEVRSSDLIEGLERPLGREFCAVSLSNNKCFLPAFCSLTGLIYLGKGLRISWSQLLVAPPGKEKFVTFLNFQKAFVPPTGVAS